MHLYTSEGSNQFIVKKLCLINMWYRVIGFHFFCMILVALYTDHWYTHILIFHLSSFFNMGLLFRIIIGTLLIGIWSLYLTFVSTWCPEYNFSIVSNSQYSILASSCKTTRFVGTFWNGKWQCLLMRWMSPFVSNAKHNSWRYSSDEPWAGWAAAAGSLSRLHQTVLDWHVVSTSNPTAAFFSFPNRTVTSLFK
jgi:hypothetical protein